MKQRTLRRAHIATSCSIVAVTMGLSHMAHAAVANGNFSAGLTGWTPSGNVAVDTTSQFGAPKAPASAQAVLGTADTGSFLFGGSAISAAALETAIGAPAGTLTSLSGFDGSALMQTVTVNAGNRLSFDWKFMSNEPQNSPANDTAFLVVDGALTPLTTVKTAALLGSSPSPLLDETAYKAFVGAPLAAGSHRIGFGIVDVPDALGASALAVTNVSLVPEPSTLALSCGGMVAALLMRRPKKRATRT